MTSADDFPGDMHRYPFDDSDADVVFGGSSGSGPVPEELQNIAELVDAARRPGSADELVDENAIVAQMAAVIGNPSAQPDEDTVSHPGDSGGRISVMHEIPNCEVGRGDDRHGRDGCDRGRGGDRLTAVAGAELGFERPFRRRASAFPRRTASRSRRRTPRPRPTLGITSTALKHPGALGVVASVNGVTDPGTCGTTGGSGSFTLTGHKGTTFIVNVDPTSTTFADEGVPTPSFANVCVGVAALAKGTVADTTVTATKVRVLPPRPPKPAHEKTGAFGIVASVNGVTDPGTCGTSGGGGSFTLTGHKGTTFIVNVDPSSTTFTDEGVPTPSFANVCVGVAALAKGTVADTTVTAASVVIAPKIDGPEHHHGHGVFGTVASVNGVTAPGTCGTSGATGSFTLTGWKNTTFTVNVDGTTKFFAPGVTSPSFANICVGAKVGATGDVTGMTVAATMAFVLPAHDGDHHKGDHDQAGKFDGGEAPREAPPGQRSVLEGCGPEQGCAADRLPAPRSRTQGSQRELTYQIFQDMSIVEM